MENDKLNKFLDRKQKIKEKLIEMNRISSYYEQLIDDYSKLYNMFIPNHHILTKNINSFLYENTEEKDLNIKAIKKNKQEIDNMLKDTIRLVVKKNLVHQNIYCKQIFKQKITSITIINDEDLFLVNNEKDNFFYSFEMNTNKKLKKYTGPSNPISMSSYEPKSQIIYGSSDKNLYLWNEEEEEPFFDFSIHEKPITCQDHMKNSPNVVTGGGDRLITLWDLSKAKVVKQFNNSKEYHPLSISCLTNKEFLTVHRLWFKSLINLWSINNDTKVSEFSFTDDVLYIKALNNGHQFFSLAKGPIINLYDIRKIQEDKNVENLLSLNLKKSSKSSIPYNSQIMDLSKNDELIAFGDENGIVNIFNCKNGSLFKTLNNTERNAPITSVSWDTINDQIYIGDEEGYLSIWELNRKGFDDE